MVFNEIKEQKMVKPLEQFKDIYLISKFCKDYCDKGTEVDKCYKKKVLKLHPDKEGDKDKFIEFSELYKKITNKKEKCST